MPFFTIEICLLQIEIVVSIMNELASQTIRNIRESKGYSQDYIAQKLGITQQAYSAGEKNPDSFTLKRLRSLSKIFQVPLSVLIGEENVLVQQNYHQQGGQAAAQMIVNGLSEAEKEMYRRTIEELNETIRLLRGLVQSK
jgi:transcriptional regulator with XRE-family HTH domain